MDILASDFRPNRLSLTVLLLAAPGAAMLLPACSGGSSAEGVGATTSGASTTSAALTTAVQVASATASTPATSVPVATTTSEVPAASATATATATLADDPEYTIQQLRKCCMALAVRPDEGFILPPRAAVIQGCKGYVELARRGETTPLQGLKDLHRLHTDWPQECNLPKSVPPR